MRFCGQNKSFLNLPVFFTGGKGSIEVWYCQKFAKITEFGSGSRENIVSLKTSKFGEKLVGVDASGSLFAWKFHKNTKHVGAFFSLQSTKQRVIHDFCFLNHGSMIAIVTATSFSIVDMLLPSAASQIETKNYGGNFINFSSNNSWILITNSKKNLIFVYDTKKSQLKTTIEVQPQNQPHSSTSEVKCTFLNKREDAFIVGTSEGHVKVFELNKFTQVSEFQAFKPIEKKQVAVTSFVQIVDSLFASSSEGTISMVHPQIL